MQLPGKSGKCAAKSRRWHTGPIRSRGVRGRPDRRNASPPDEALSDGNHSILPSQLELLMTEVRQMAAVLGRQVAGW